MSDQRWQDLNGKLIDSYADLQMFKVHCYTKSMIQAIIKKKRLKETFG